MTPSNAGETTVMVKPHHPHRKNMAPISSIYSNRNDTFICEANDAEPTTFDECSDESYRSDNWQREYHRLTSPSNNLSPSKKMNNGDKVALSGIVAGTGFLIGGPIGLAASALLLTGCYGLDGIGSANEQPQNGDGGENSNENNLRTNIDGGINKNPMPATTTWKKISAYGDNVCGVKMNGSIDCWSNIYDPEDLKRELTGTFDDVSVGESHACGLRTNGEIKCSGNNFNGQAQNQSGIFLQVSAGFDYTCAITDQHYIRCWGDEANDINITDTPSGIFSYINACGFRVCGVQSNDRTVNCWPNDTYGPSGAFPQISGRFSQVSVSGYYGCGVTMDDAIECWVAPDFTQNEYGQNYGQADPPSGRFSQVSVAGGSFSCGLRTDQSIDCWGLLDNSQTFAPTEIYQVPEHIDGNFIQVVASGAFIYAIKADHSLECWGNNDICKLTPAP